MPARIDAGARQATRFLKSINQEFTVEYATEAGTFDAYGDPNLNAAVTATIYGIEDTNIDPKFMRSAMGELTDIDAFVFVPTAEWAVIAANFDADARKPEIITPAGRRYVVYGWSDEQNGATALNCHKTIDTA